MCSAFFFIKPTSKWLTVSIFSDQDGECETRFFTVNVHLLRLENGVVLIDRPKYLGEEGECGDEAASRYSSIAAE